MKTQFARREFIKRAGLTLGGLGMSSVVFESILSHFFQRAFAQSLGTTINPSGYYVHMTMPGGPPRWYFDLPLTPAGKTAGNFVQGGFGTRIEKVAGEFKSIYHVEKHTVGGRTIHLPPVWNFGAGGKKFTDILPHTVFVRGLDMEINNHGLSNARQTAPTIGGISLNGVVADGAARPMPCIVDPGSAAAGGFKSIRGFSSSAISYAESATVNPISSLLNPFKNYMTGRTIHAAGANRLQEQAFREFEKYAGDRGITASALTEMYDNAMELMEQNIFQLSNQWAPTVAKYRALVDDALYPNKGSLPGIFDAAIAGKNNGLYKFDVGADRWVNLTDIRDMVTASTKAPQMAENFAIAEILLDKATSTMNLSFRGLTGAQSGRGIYTVTHDQHNIGSVVSTVMTTLFYRSFLSCMTEFVGALKTKNIFDRTVLHISSEFNRTPKAEGDGADHGFMASNTTLISGMIQKNDVIGNIQKASYSNTYTGTFGVATRYDSDGFTRPIQVNDVARTISAMLGVDDIVTNGRALLAPSGKEWVVRKREAKNV